MDATFTNSRELQVSDSYGHTIRVKWVTASRFQEDEDKVGSGTVTIENSDGDIVLSLSMDDFIKFKTALGSIIPA